MVLGTLALSYAEATLLSLIIPRSKCIRQSELLSLSFLSLISFQSMVYKQNQANKLRSPGCLVQIHTPLPEFILKFQNDSGYDLISAYLCRTISDPNLSQSIMVILESDPSPHKLLN